MLAKRPPPGQGRHLQTGLAWGLRSGQRGPWWGCFMERGVTGAGCCRELRTEGSLMDKCLEAGCPMEIPGKCQHLSRTEDCWEMMVYM